MTAILTGLYDHYDDLKEIPAQSVPVEAVCVTDNPDLRSDTWTVVYEPRPNLHPNVAAKWPKMMPWLYTDCDSSVWIDASIRLTSPFAVEEMLALADPIAQFKHPDRDCCYEEADVSLGWEAKYGDEPLDQQVKRYREWGHPEHWGLWCTGIRAMHHTPEVKAMCVDWLAEVHAWSFQDQVSQPVMLNKHGLRPNILPGRYWGGLNPWLRWEGSNRH